MLQTYEREIDDLKMKIAEVLAVMPSPSMSSHSSQQQQQMGNQGSFGSPLDPNARIYTPNDIPVSGAHYNSSSLSDISVSVSAAHSAILEALGRVD
jgi:hypothetical protein